MNENNIINNSKTFFLSQNDMELKFKINQIKTNLKNIKTFKKAVEELIKLMSKYLNYDTKRIFWDCLNIISYRIGKPGFDAKIAEPLFNLAYENKEAFSNGLRKHVEDWKMTIDEIIKNPEQTIMRKDGE